MSRPTPAELEVARALIARVKAADSSIDRRDELWYASDSDALDRRDWHVRQFSGFRVSDFLKLDACVVVMLM